MTFKYFLWVCLKITYFSSWSFSYSKPKYLVAESLFKGMAQQIYVWHPISMNGGGCLEYTKPMRIGANAQMTNSNTNSQSLCLLTCSLVPGWTHLRVHQMSSCGSWDRRARSRLPTLERGTGSSWEPRD